MDELPPAERTRNKALARIGDRGLLAAMPDEVRCFPPPPWTIDGNDSCFWVADADGRRLAYVYFDERPWGVGTASAARLSRVEALRLVGYIAKLPELSSKRAD